MGKAPLSEGLSCSGGGFCILVVWLGWDCWPLYCALALRSLLGLFLFFSFFCLLSLVFAGVLVRLCPYSELQVLRPPRSCAFNFQWLLWLWSVFRCCSGLCWLCTTQWLDGGGGGWWAGVLAGDKGTFFLHCLLCVCWIFHLFWLFLLGGSWGSTQSWTLLAERLGFPSGSLKCTILFCL